MVSFTPLRFTSRVRSPGIHWIGGWMDPRAGLYAMEKKKSFPCLELNPYHLCPKPVAVLTELSWLSARFSSEEGRWAKNEFRFVYFAPRKKSMYMDVKLTYEEM
jgi:hypothetical protein